MKLELPAHWHGAQIVPVALGLFTGLFWVADALLRVPLTPASAARLALECLPGAGTLLLVALARREPVVYGAALSVLGVVPLFWGPDRLGAKALFVFCLPVAAAGWLFIWTGRHRTARPAPPAS